MIDDEFRAALGRFATGVTLVTVDGPDGDHGMTVNSFASVSLDPPLVLFNADRGTDTHDYVADAGHFAVNVLTADQQWLSTRFAGAHKDMADPFEDVPLHRGETGAPLVDDALATIDCTLWDAVDGGDHTIYVGEVVGLETGAADALPLTFYKGEYGTIDT